MGFGNKNESPEFSFSVKKCKQYCHDCARIAPLRASKDSSDLLDNCLLAHLPWAHLPLCGKQALFALVSN